MVHPQKKNRRPVHFSKTAPHEIRQMLPERKKRVQKVTLEGHRKIDNFHFHSFTPGVQSKRGIWKKSKSSGIPNTRSDTK